jgi:hypothetical protein
MFDCCGFFTLKFRIKTYLKSLKTEAGKMAFN